jgi:hypothetical protein
LRSLREISRDTNKSDNKNKVTGFLPAGFIFDGENMIRKKVLVRKRDGQIRVINTENIESRKTRQEPPLSERKTESGENPDHEDKKSSETLHY